VIRRGIIDATQPNVLRAPRLHPITSPPPQKGLLGARWARTASSDPLLSRQSTEALTGQLRKFAAGGSARSVFFWEAVRRDPLFRVAGREVVDPALIGTGPIQNVAG
jgi:hypothetical protein